MNRSTMQSRQAPPPPPAPHAAGRKWKTNFDQRTHRRHDNFRMYDDDDDDEDDDDQFEQQSERASEKSGSSDKRAPSRWSGTASSGAGRKSGTNAPPPSYDGSREAGAFDDYRIKAKLWLKTSNLDDSMKGARLLQGLTGRAFDQMKHLAEDETCKALEGLIRPLKVL